MTEGEWLACDDPGRMLRAVCCGDEPDRRVLPTPSGRKLRLWACACARAHWDHLADARSRAAVQAAERVADGEDANRSAAFVAADRVYTILVEGGVPQYAPPRLLSLLARDTLQATGAGAAQYVTLRLDRVAPGHRPATAALLREIVGNPWRPVTLPESITGEPSVRELALAAYTERDPATGHLDPVRLAVLSDALEEAGCASEPLLMHLRGREWRLGVRKEGPVWETWGWHPLPGPHVRGCWAVDLVLGKG